MNGCGVMHHESVGASFLRSLGFRSRVCKLVECHVQAKRYLCYARPDYYSSLSEASRTTLTFQGSIMTSDEAKAFEEDSDFNSILLMRECDEAGKVPDLQVPSLLYYRKDIDMLCDNNPSLTYDNSVRYHFQLSDFQRQHYENYGYLKISNLMSFVSLPPGVLSKWCDEIASWPKTTDKWITHYEECNKSIDGVSDQQLQQLDKMLCRCENFVNYHNGMNDLAQRLVLNIVSQLFNEPAKLFKEKINFKLPGGAGFMAHQDSPAYIGLAKDHISVMVAVDAATEENGCLQVCKGRWKATDDDRAHNEAVFVPLTSEGVIVPDVEATMSFDHITCCPGDVLLFSGYLPHRSFNNLSPVSRRAIFLTYNPSSQGDHHSAYYHAKLSRAHGFDSNKTLSFVNDFRGKIVE